MIFVTHKIVFWSHPKGRNQVGNCENYALQSSTVLEGSDPPAGPARLTISGETALCKKTRSSMTNQSYWNKWKLVFQIPAADDQCLSHTLCCNCTARVIKSDHPTSVQHIWSQ